MNFLINYEGYIRGKVTLEGQIRKCAIIDFPSAEGRERMDRIVAEIQHQAQVIEDRIQSQMGGVLEAGRLDIIRLKNLLIEVMEEK